MVRGFLLAYLSFAIINVITPALTTDEQYMHRCLQLAGAGAGYVAPNPMVGAVLVHDNRIIGEGYHGQYGMPMRK